MKRINNIKKIAVLLSMSALLIVPACNKSDEDMVIPTDTNGDFYEDITTATPASTEYYEEFGETMSFTDIDELETTPEETTVSESSDELFRYTADEAGITITGLVEGEFPSEIIVPKFIGDMPVVAIGEAAFRDNKTLQSITLQEGIITVGNNAFNGCDELKEVSIANTVAQIGSAAFADCVALTEITVPGSVVTVGNSAFKGCTSLTGVILNDGVKNIEPYAFNACTSLVTITLPGSVTSLGACAFYRCDALEEVILSDALTRISFGTFMYCRRLKTIEIPNSVEIIDYKAFAKCINLKNVHFTDSVTRIERDAFEECGQVVAVALNDTYASAWASENGLKTSELVKQ